MTVIHGDCIEVMAGMEPESVDAIVTDPPYGLEFMGKEWDKFKETGVFAGGGPLPPNKPEGFVGSDGVRRSKTNAFSTNVATPRIIGGSGAQQFHARWAEAAYRVAKPSAYLLAFGGTRTVHRMTVALEDAGWIIRDMLVWGYASGFPKSKASLKPAWEPIVMARKPGPLRELAIDACRIPATAEDVAVQRARTGGEMGAPTGNVIYGPGVREPAGNDLGRWPANIVLTDPIFDGGIEGVVGGGETSYGPVIRDIDGDSGTYSRFFLVPKADRADREPVLGGLPERDSMKWAGGSEKMQGIAGAYPDGSPRPPQYRANHHPTVKPTDLMRHLVRLVTPSGGVVLDPFLGSGSTGLAAEMEGFDWIGIEREEEYVRIAEARLNGTQRGMAL